MDIKIAAVGLACPFEIGYDQSESLLADTVEKLSAEGVVCHNTGVVMHDLDTVNQAVTALKGSDADVLLVCIATWSEDHHLLDLLSYVDKPIILRAYPARDTGSLCCAHQIGAVFTDIGRGYDFVYGESDSVVCAEKTKSIATSYALVNTMKTVRLGTVGGRVKGMTEIAYDEFSIKQKLGARIVNIDETEMLGAVDSISDEQADALLAKKHDCIKRCTVTSSADGMRESIKYYHALRSLVDKYDLQALAVKCYTTYMGKVCLGYSFLSEEGIVSSCEGDVTNSLTMKLLYELSGKPVNNTDYLYHDEQKNTILFAHCGSSGFSIADGEIELAPVRLAEAGVCCRFVTKPGIVTAVNICGHGDNLRMAIMVGESIPCGMEFPGNPVVICFDKKVEQINNEIVENGIGHHWMIGYGDYSEELKRFCKIQNIHCYVL